MVSWRPVLQLVRSVLCGLRQHWVVVTERYAGLSFCFCSDCDALSLAWSAIEALSGSACMSRFCNLPWFLQQALLKCKLLVKCKLPYSDGSPGLRSNPDLRSCTPWLAAGQYGHGSAVRALDRCATRPRAECSAGKLHLKGLSHQPPLQGACSSQCCQTFDCGVTAHRRPGSPPRSSHLVTL